MNQGEYRHSSISLKRAPTMFSTIQDAVDPSISIIKHVPTGFYNVTKAANQFYELYSTESKKRMRDWLPLVQTKALFEATKEIYNLGDAMIQLITNTRDEHKGTYVHHTLYRSFLMWLNAKYAIKIFAVIDEHQRAFEEDLKSKNASLQNTNTSLQNTIDSVHSKLDLLISDNETIKAQAKHTEEQFEILKDHAEDLQSDLESTRTTLESKLDTVVGMLRQKSVVSTKNPRNREKVHHFLVMGYDFMDEENRNARRLSFIAGQETRIRVAKKQKLEDEDHQWAVELEKHYNANPIDLRNNIEDVVNEFIKNRLQEINADATIPISREDIPITCKKLSATYIENDYISYEELIDVIRSVNVDTQRCPYAE